MTTVQLFKSEFVMLPCATRSQKLEHPNMRPQSKPLDQNKLTQFTSNTVRKSKREKEAEAAEAKRREEEEQNAKVCLVPVQAASFGST